MYGLPKIHKRKTPLRPILSTVGTYNYNMSQFLVPLLSVLIRSCYTVKDSFSFVKEICSFRNDNYVMASFDVSSLFTNIPIDETCTIILNEIFPSDDSVYNGFRRKDFSKILDNCTKNNIFLFNKQLYQQKDGAPMGGCVSPSLANIFFISS